jgi:glutaminyl-peptide cyclotransferase
MTTTGTARNLILWLGTVLTMAACQVTPSCAPSAPPTPTPTVAPAPTTFDEERAWTDLEYLVETIGRRRIGTKGSQQTRDYIREQLQPLGWEFEDDLFHAEPPEGANRKSSITGTNLIARFPGKGEKSIWLASHYDTFDKPKFVGANDSGSSTVVLMEIARQIAAMEPAWQGPPLTLVWFDGEEPFYPVNWDDTRNSTFGSRHLAEKIKSEGTEKSILALILLDMVGDKKLGLELEYLSDSWLKEHFRNTASKLGYGRYITGEMEIKDDHRPFLDIGVPAIDLIDFHYPGAGNEYWHTADDVLEHCSKESLGIVGRLVMAALPGLSTR